MKNSDIGICVISIILLFGSLFSRIFYSLKNSVKISFLYSILKLIALIIGGVTYAKVLLNERVTNVFF